MNGTRGQWTLAGAGLLWCLGLYTQVWADNPTLDPEQLKAANIVIARPARMTLPERVQALGLVLDPTGLATEWEELQAARAAQRAADASVSRLSGLIDAGGGASKKMLDGARIEQAKAHAELSIDNTRYAQHWGPIAILPDAQRSKLMDAVTLHDALLVRADLPGHNLLGALPQSAILTVDGVEVSARVLGPLRQTSELQSAAILLEVEHAPLGLSPGAHLEVALLSAKHKGVSLPSAAVLYEDSDAFVFKRLSGTAQAGKTAFTAVKVSLLLPLGDRWLVQGVEDDDDVVVEGAGTLWSLQGAGATAAADDDD